jgi:hypothetical protein
LQFQPPRLEQIPGLAAERTAQFLDHPEACVVASSLQPIEGRMADPESLGHVFLAQFSFLSQAAQGFGQLSGEVHAEQA